MKILLLTVTLIAGLCALEMGKASHRQVVVGGFREVPLDRLSPLQTLIQTQIRDSVVDVKNDKLVGLKEQLVAGMNYCYTFRNTKGDAAICVWNKSWEKFRELSFSSAQGRQNLKLPSIEPEN